MKFKTVLSIAGFDGSGGAGIQADLKTFSAFGCYGMTVLTALPIQNTCGVKNCYAISATAVLEQLETIFEDIKPNAIKIGMLFNNEIIDVVIKFLNKHAKEIPIVLDPVMVAKSGHLLLLEDAILNLKTNLIPISTIITPNLFEAEKLLGISLMTQGEMEMAARELLALGSKAVILKGGHLQGKKSDDVYVDSFGRVQWFLGSRIDTKNSHGTGCTFSAALASCLAFGFDNIKACDLAKAYIQDALCAAKELELGQGHGPVHHFYHLWPSLEKIVNKE